MIVELNPMRWFRMFHPARVPASVSAKAVEKSMSVQSVLQTVENDVTGFFGKLVADFQKAKAVWSAISNPQTRALLVKVGGDAIWLAKDVEGAATSGGLNLTLDLQTVNDIKQLIADAKAGDGVIVSDLALLGIKL